MAILASLQSSERAIVLVTHDPSVGEAAERRVRMRDGEIIADEVVGSVAPQ
jgi:putative ABC transport system ATP-binding protein